MKYDSLRKIHRNKTLTRFRDQHGLSFEKLGKIFGVSKQRAHQIYWAEKKKNG